MALKAIIHKATLEISDLDRQLYSDHSLTIARHPSETDERMLIRLLAFALNVPANEDHGALEFAKDMWEPDEPALWRRDLTGRIAHWIEVGQPDEKRILRASSNAGQTTMYSFASSTSTWWKDIQPKLARARNLSVWQIPADQSQALARLAQRAMALHVTVQEGSVYVADAGQSCEVTPIRLSGD
jgi:uncharacterized protein YaeQ